MQTNQIQERKNNPSEPMENYKYESTMFCKTCDKELPLEETAIFQVGAEGYRIECMECGELIDED